MTEVKARVKIGTLSFEQGTFSKGDVITVSEERFKQFDPNDVEAIEETTPKSEIDFKQATSDTITVSDIPLSEPELPKAIKPRRAKQE